LQLVTDSSFRNKLVVELCELLAFLQQRHLELSSESAHISTALPESIQQYTLASVQTLSLAVSESKAAFTDGHLAELLALVSSHHTFNRTTTDLIQKASQEAKFYRLDQNLAEIPETTIPRLEFNPALHASMLIAKEGRLAHLIEDSMYMMMGAD